VHIATNIIESIYHESKTIISAPNIIESIYHESKTIISASSGWRR
jgi:hypothetical protein